MALPYITGGGAQGPANLPDTTALDAKITAHNISTAVHGIANTANLATKTYADTAVSSHQSDTTSVHGITDTANLVLTNDSRLSDARTPTTHTHVISDVTSLQSTIIAFAIALG